MDTTSERSLRAVLETVFTADAGELRTMELNCLHIAQSIRDLYVEEAEMWLKRAELCNMARQCAAMYANLCATVRVLKPQFVAFRA